MKGLTVFLFCAVWLVCDAQKKSFDGYKVHRLKPGNAADLAFLHSLESDDSNVQFLQSPRKVNDNVDFIVAPQADEAFFEKLASVGLNSSVVVSDLQQLFEKHDLVGNFDALNKREGLKFDRYYRLDDINAWLDSLEYKYPYVVKSINGGSSYEKRLIKGVKISFSDDAKRAVFIDGGIHAREWISPATVTYIINELLTSKDPAFRKLARHYTWYIFPVINPDGYVYSHNTNRLWRKNRRIQKQPDDDESCNGVDLNRNWDWVILEGDRRLDKCQEVYHGKSSFSEDESRTLSGFIKEVAGSLDAYLSFHSYGQKLLIPYGHSVAHLDNYEVIEKIGLKVAKAISKRYGTKYIVGATGDIEARVSGTNVDWVKKNFGTKIVLTYELHPSHDESYGFVLPSDQIIPTAEEIIDSLITLFSEASKEGLIDFKY